MIDDDYIKMVRARIKRTNEPRLIDYWEHITKNGLPPREPQEQAGRVCTDPEKYPDEWKDLVATEMAEREKRKDIICEHIKKCNDPDEIKFWEWIIETVAENEKKT